MTALTAGVMGKAQRINVPEGSTEMTEKVILGLKQGEVNPELWSKLVEYKLGDEPKLMLVLEASLTSAGVENNGAIEDELIKVISNSKATDDGKQFACRLLQRIGSDKCIPALSKLLNDEKMSHFARLALERIPARDALREALPKASDSLKPGIIGSIGEFGDNTDVPALSKYARSKDTDIAGSAMKALANIGTAEALAALKKVEPVESLKTTHRDAMMSIAAKVGDASVFDAIAKKTGEEDFAAGLRGLLKIDEDSAVERITSLITCPHDETRRDLLQIITMEPSKKLTESICKKLPAINVPNIQIELISALGTRGDPVALATITKFIDHDNKEIANTAIAALGELNSSESINPLLLKMKSPQQAVAAKKALGAISYAGADDALISALQDKTITVQVIAVLSERMAFYAAPAIIKLLNDGNEDIRKAAWSAAPMVCGASDTEAIMSSLLKLEDKREISRATKCVVVLASNVSDKKACFNAALKFNENASDPVRNLILDLGAIAGTAEALEMVKSAYASDDKDLKSKALRVLCAWSTINAAPILIDLAENGEDERTRILSLRGYIRLAGLEWRELVDDKHNFDKGMVKKYDMLLSASKLAIRKEEKASIISALSDMGNIKRMQEVELVMTYIDDPEVKIEAEIAALNLIKRLAKHKPEEVLPIAQKLYETSENKHVKFHANKTIETCKSGGASKK